MEYLRGATKGLKNQELLLGGLFIAYASLDVETPTWVNEFATSNTGKVFLILLAISLFKFLKPVVAVLGLIAIYELLRRANRATGLHPESLFNFLPSTNTDPRDLSIYNEYENTLEEEMVSKMAPLAGPSVGKVSYRPEVEDTHDAAIVN
jgi:hypothetical protein